MSSFDAVIGYGTDEFTVNSNDMNDFSAFNYLDSSTHNREARMMNKINQYMPCAEHKRDNYCEDKDMYSEKGVNSQKNRQYKRENIEKFYYANKEIKDKCEGFSDRDYEIKMLEQKNDTLVFFVFVLAIVVIVQMFKTKNPEYIVVHKPNEANISLADSVSGVSEVSKSDD